MKCIWRCLIKRKPLSAGTALYRDICSVLLSTGLAVLENNPRELAYLANLGKLSTIQRVRTRELWDTYLGRKPSRELVHLSYQHRELVIANL
jgi:hypothetical protein